jgi:hypothetical protein
MSKSFWDGSPNDDVTMDSFDYSRVTMQEIPFKLAKDIIIKHHYSHAFPSAEVNLGFYVDGKLNSVIVYGKSATSKMADSLPGKYLELVRLFSFDWAGKNMESYCISKSIKYIQKHHPDIKVLVSFADPEQGHDGIVYQATNWLYCGKSQPDEWYIVDNQKIHPRSMVAKYGTRGEKKLKKMGIDFERKLLHGKHRYIYLLGSTKSEKKFLKRNLQYDVLPYPKNRIN